MKTLILLLGICFSGAKGFAAFSIKKDNDTLVLMENGKKVFRYHINNPYPEKQRSRAHFFHPVYDLNERELTVDRPIDHRHHHGLWWAWPQLQVDGESVGDPWEVRGMDYLVREVHFDQCGEESCTINFDVLWLSLKNSDQNGSPQVIVEEKSQVTIYKLTDGPREMDFSISLTPKVGGVTLSGSNNDKGYGGFSFRMKTPRDLAFISAEGPVNPERTAVSGGGWMHFRGSFNDQVISSITIVQDRNMPGYPQKWILRQARAMQNPAFPGVHVLPLNEEMPLLLEYKVLIHRDAGDVEALQDRFSRRPNDL